MGTFTTGIGLISGIDIASYIDAVLAGESQGKVRLQQRIATLQAQQTALLDINARLLNFKNASRAFRIDRIFQSALATSGNSDILTASASSRAQPGTFQFIVKQLVSTSQKLSAGFATSDESPLGLDAISFEFGNGMLARDRSLEELNGGNGIDRGNIIITDSAASSATIDLTDVTTVNEVLERINEASAVSVTAAVSGNHIVITDTAGGAGTMSIDNASGDTTATDLGIQGTAVGGVITGSDIYTLGLNTPLASLNDGNGVLIVDNVTDFTIWGRDNVAYEIDLGRIDLPIDDDTLLADLNSGNGVSIDSDPDTADIAFVARDGTHYDVDLTGVTTVGGLRSRIAAETGGHITLTIHADGDRFTVTDTVGGGASLLKVLGGDNGTDVAEELGILEEDGVEALSFDGELVPANIDQAAAATIGDVIDRINNAVDSNGVPNDGRLIASIGDDGKSIKLTDTIADPVRALEVIAGSANPYAAEQLGILVAPSGSVINGEQIIGGLHSVMIDSINGGRGLDGATSITVTDRGGIQSFTLDTLDAYETLDELIDALNDEAAANSVDVTFSLNGAGNGLLVTDTSGGSGNLVITGDGATALGIEADVAANSVYGENLQLQYVSIASRLEDLNYGRGIGTGTFRITDGLGNSAEVNIGGDEDTLYDVIAEINSRGLAVQARVNDNGDGLIIEEYEDGLGGQTPFVKIKVETVSGSAGADLNLIGESADIEGGYIDGSYERSVDLAASDTLDEVIEKINDAGIPVTASLLNTGAGATPYRLNLTSSISGRAGEMVIDTGGVDIGLTSLSQGRDAKVFFGAENPEDGFLITSSTNTLDDVLQGVTIDLHQASDEAVTLTITRDVESIVESVKQFVTTFNDVIGRIDDYDFYNTETEEKGILLGDPTAANIQSSLYRIATGRAMNVSSSFQYLTQIGITINSNGEMAFDEEAFRDAYAEDPDALESLFAEYDVTSSTTQTVADGVTISSDDLTYNALGFGSLFDRLLEQLTDSIDGTVTLADDALSEQIKIMESRIEDIDVRLEARRQRLMREFMAMETALAQLQSQSTALSNLSLLASQSSSSLGLMSL